VARWLVALQGYDFEVQHRPGRPPDGVRPLGRGLTFSNCWCLSYSVPRSSSWSTGVGHFGNSKTLHHLCGRFYWPGCRQDVELHVHCCELCTAKKGPTQRSHAPLQQYLVGAPMERVGVDILGPFPTTDGGNRYVLLAMDYFTKSLSLILWSYRSAVQESNRCTPAALMLGRVFTEVVYQVRMPGRGRMEVLHRDRLAPYPCPACCGEGGPGQPTMPRPAWTSLEPRVTRSTAAPLLRSLHYIGSD